MATGRGLSKYTGPNEEREPAPPSNSAFQPPAAAKIQKPEAFIVFALVAYETKVLVQAISPLINASDVEEHKDAIKCGQLTEKMLEKIFAQLKTNHKKTLSTQSYSFHYIMASSFILPILSSIPPEYNKVLLYEVLLTLNLLLVWPWQEDGIVYICAAHPDFEQKIAFGFLRDTREKFVRKYTTDHIREAKVKKTLLTYNTRTDRREREGRGREEREREREREEEE